MKINEGMGTGKTMYHASKANSTFALCMSYTNILNFIPERMNEPYTGLGSCLYSTGLEG